MARKRDRFFALFGAILFLVTSSALAIAVIIILVQQNNQNKSSNSTASTASQTKSSTSTTANQQGSKLQGFTPVSSVATLKTTDLKVGTGAEAKSGDTVTVNYTGAVAATGVIFQSENNISFSLSQVIEGWSLGIPGMKVGGTRQLLIPANLAYGANPPSGSGIPANAPLVFNVTLDKVQ